MTAARRPVFGETYRPLPPTQRGYQGEPLLKLCAIPSPAIVARGWPCHRCLANVAPAGAPAACFFLRGDTDR